MCSRAPTVRRSRSSTRTPRGARARRCSRTRPLTPATYHPRHVTGACMVALGPWTAGLFANDDIAQAAYAKAASEQARSYWRCRSTRACEMLKSDIVDMKLRATAGRRSDHGGALPARVRCRQDVKRMTLDIAGPARSASAHGVYPKGGTGWRRDGRALGRRSLAASELHSRPPAMRGALSRCDRDRCARLAARRSRIWHRDLARRALPSRRRERRTRASCHARPG